jgi:hypothetical protein
VYPTAHASLAEATVTLVKLLPADAGFGLGTMLHIAPSHRSINPSWRVPSELVPSPTAQSWLVPGIAATPLSVLDEPRLGLETTDHLVPLHCSAKVSSR